MSAETIKPKDSMLSSFAEECTTMLLALGTPVISVIVSAVDLRLALPTLALGEGLAAASFVTGRILNRHNNGGLPKRAIPSENPTP